MVFKTNLSRRRISLSLAAVALTPMTVQAQAPGAGATPLASAFPSKPITIIVPFAPGGNTDVKTRLVAQQLTALLGQTVIVDNKPGASGNIGMELLSRAAPDGYTIGMGSFGPLAVNPSLYPRMRFAVDAFSPIILLEKSPLVLVTPVSRSFRSLADVLVAARAAPGTLTIANAGPGGAHHLSAELLESATQTQMVGIPYKGGGPASLALMAGQVDLMFEQTGAAVPSIKAGKVRALAVTSEKRLPALADVPTFVELDLPLVTVSNWMGYVAPKGTPVVVLARLHEAFASAIGRPEVKGTIAAQNNEFGGGSPEDFGRFIASERARWASLIKSRGIVLE